MAKAIPSLTCQIRVLSSRCGKPTHGICRECRKNICPDHMGPNDMCMMCQPPLIDLTSSASPELAHLTFSERWHVDQRADGMHLILTFTRPLTTTDLKLLWDIERAFNALPTVSRLHIDVVAR